MMELQRLRRLGLALLGALALPFAAPSLEASPAQQSREQASLADEQRLLLQQLSRLSGTMNVLEQRFVAEGRTQAAKLLREGLQHLGLRAKDGEERTLQELMLEAQEGIEDGQPVSALETQERIVGGLERLLSILMDRRDVEDLDKSLKQLQDINEALGQLADDQGDLRDETDQLQQDAAGEQERQRRADLAELTRMQRELLRATEEAGMESGSFDLERLEAELAELLERQKRDAAVLADWDPEL
ncbi:MAG: hypothetical protein AAF368_07535, partial [Planctomycetota bacterium]